MSNNEPVIDVCDLIHSLMWDAIPLGAVLTTADGSRIVRANPAFCTYIGFDETEIIGRTTKGLSLWPEPEERVKFFRMLAKNKTVRNFPVTLKRRNGDYLALLLSTTQIEASRRLFFLHPPAAASLVDESRLAEKDKKIALLEKKLEKMDAALEVMLEKLARKERGIRERTATQIKKSVIPFVEKLKHQSINGNASAYLAVIEENLMKIACGAKESSPFFQNGFTVNEIQILELIKQGKRSKEIAALLHLSMATIAYHRHNIRKKLGIDNNKENLFSHLHSLEQGPVA